MLQRLHVNTRCTRPKLQYNVKKLPHWDADTDAAAADASDQDASS